MLPQVETTRTLFTQQNSPQKRMRERERERETGREREGGRETEGGRERERVN